MNLILDTNVALDLWLFEDPRVAALRSALASHSTQHVGCDQTQAELAHVLGRRVELDRHKPWSTRHAQALQSWAATVAPASAASARPHPTQTTPRCPDADDQKFIDLAAAHAPAWLLSRDRHILKLKKPLLKLGVRAALPEQWVPLDPAVKPG